MKRLAVIGAALLLTLSVAAAPSYIGFAAGAFLQGPESGVAVPNVIGLSEAAADMAFEAVGLDTGTVATRCSTEMMGLVVLQDPAPGAFAPLASTVDIQTSNGVACPLHGRPGVRQRGLRMPGI